MCIRDRQVRDAVRLKAYEAEDRDRGFKTYETIPQDIWPPVSDPMWILPDTRGIKKRPADYAIHPENVHINPLRSTYVFQ